MYCNYELDTVEGFAVNGKHSREYNLILLDRIADPPQEKQIIENVPFMQGVYDFSAILNQRVYENRPIQFEMLIVDYVYERRKSIETSLTNWLMQPFNIKLYDDFNRNYYYIAKCESINYEDRYEGMTAVITFDAYPFMIGELLEGNDIWDTFNFELDVSQITEYEIKGIKEVTLFNPGSNLVSPKIRASSNLEIIKENQTFNVSAGTSESSEFVFHPGENKLTIKGNGTIEFLFYKELL